MTTCVNAQGQPAPCSAPLSWLTRAKLAYEAGFRGNDLVTILAISQAESGGISNRQQDGGGAGYGVVQIDRTQHPNVSVSNAINPSFAFQYAYSLFQQAGGKFTPWTTYTNNAYLQFFPQASEGAGSLQGNINNYTGTIDPSTPVLGGAKAGITAVNNANNALDSLPGAVAGIPGQIGTVLSNTGKSLLPYVVLIGGLIISAIFLLRNFVR